MRDNINLNEQLIMESYQQASESVSYCLQEHIGGRGPGARLRIELIDLESLLVEALENNS